MPTFQCMASHSCHSYDITQRKLAEFGTKKPLFSTFTRLWLFWSNFHNNLQFFLRLNKKKFQIFQKPFAIRNLLWFVIDCESQVSKENKVHNFDMSGEDYIIKYSIQYLFFCSIYSKILKMTHPYTIFVLYAQNRWAGHSKHYYLYNAKGHRDICRKDDTKCRDNECYTWNSNTN